jgi:hypothetical protein
MNPKDFADFVQALKSNPELRNMLDFNAYDFTPGQKKLLGLLPEGPIAEIKPPEVVSGKKARPINRFKDAVKAAQSRVGIEKRNVEQESVLSERNIEESGSSSKIKKTGIPLKTERRMVIRALEQGNTPEAQILSLTKMMNAAKLNDTQKEKMLAELSRLTESKTLAAKPGVPAVDKAKASRSLMAEQIAGSMPKPVATPTMQAPVNPLPAGKPMMEQLRGQMAARFTPEQRAAMMQGLPSVAKAGPVVQGASAAGGLAPQEIQQLAQQLGVTTGEQAPLGLAEEAVAPGNASIPSRAQAYPTGSEMEGQAPISAKDALKAKKMSKAQAILDKMQKDQAPKGLAQKIRANKSMQGLMSGDDSFNAMKAYAFPSPEEMAKMSPKKLARVIREAKIHGLSLDKNARIFNKFPQGAAALGIAGLGLAGADIGMDIYNERQQAGIQNEQARAQIAAYDPETEATMQFLQAMGMMGQQAPQQQQGLPPEMAGMLSSSGGLASNEMNVGG